MEENWILRNRKYKALAERLHVDPLLAKIIANRVEPEKAEDFWNKDAPLENPFLMADMEVAVTLILAHIEVHSKIKIIGDYDVDGISSAAILYRGLTGLGADVSVRIPSRMEDGYGIHKGMIQDCQGEGVRLILTCDNGIREFEAAAYAREVGLDLVITDHHEITPDENGADVLPAADAILNPHRQDCAYPYKQLCGAGVAFKLMEALYERQKQDKRQLENLLGLAALATICDVCPLLGENRRIVYRGLEQLNTNPITGIRAIMQQGDIGRMDVYTCGYVLGPMLNSGGRLERQDKYIDILIKDEAEKAAELAKDLFELNRKRQALTEEGIQAGVAQMETQLADDMVKVVYLPEIHESIAGLIAGKLKERYCRPVFVLTKAESGVKGSGRSIPGYSMFEEMQKVKDVFTKFGGHPMAAGLSMEETRVEEFRRRINEVSTLSQEACVPCVYIDAAYPTSHVSIGLVKALDELGPYGTGNPRPIFAEKGVELRQCRIMGKNRSVARVSFVKDGEPAEGVLFRLELLQRVILARYGPSVWRRLEQGEYMRDVITVDLCYQAGIHEYKGETSAQITITNIR